MADGGWPDGGAIGIRVLVPIFNFSLLNGKSRIHFGRDPASRATRAMILPSTTAYSEASDSLVAL